MPIQAGYHSRGYLPHIKVEGAAYFVTFRLADSLPREVILRLKEQHEDLLRRIDESGSDDKERRKHELFERYAHEIDAVLDQHTGAAFLNIPAIATLVSEALRHFEGDRYSLHAWCVMPNHVHVVVRPHALHTLDAILHSWKSFTATKANRALDRVGQPFWQHESFDRWIRGDLELASFCRYTEENPVKAKLCAKVQDWPWSSAGFRPVRVSKAG